MPTKGVENLVDSVGNIPVNYGNVEIICEDSCFYSKS
jgi:hypothetical protein